MSSDPVYSIIDLGAGWFDFKNIPQEKSYIKIHGLNCGSRKAAEQRAEKIAQRNELKNYTFTFKRGE